MTASLAHAQSILAAAINAGFRESGVQSLKNLNDPNAFPMVAIRTSGLALSSLIGLVDDEPDPSRPRSLVSEEYLRILLDVANGRFEANAERIRRFRHEILERTSTKSLGWEDASSRKERKKAEGRERRSMLCSEPGQAAPEDNYESILESCLFDGAEDTR